VSGGARRPVFLRLVAYGRPYLGAILASLLFGLIYSGARNLRAWLLKPFLDATPPGGGPSSASIPFVSALAERWKLDSLPGLGHAPEVVVGALAVVVLLPLAHFGKEYLSQWTLGRVLVDIQQAVCAKLLALPLRFHHGTTRGDTLSRTLNDVQKSNLALQVFFSDVVQSAIAIGVGFSVMLAISWQLSLASLTIAPLVIGVVAVFGQRIRKSARRRQEQLGDLTQRLVEILAGIKVIQAFRAEATEAARFSQSNQRLFRRSMRVVKNRVLARTSIEGLTNAIGVALLLVGTVLVAEGSFGLTRGTIAAFLAVLASTYGPAKDLTKGWSDLMDSLPATERFFELLDDDSALVDPPDAVRVDGVRTGIRVSKLRFSYGREPVLQDVDFEVRAGELVAIVGRTGAGKSTLADLLLRFYDPDDGSIEVDGVDLRRLARDSWLAQVAVVTQDPFLFTGTIRDNVRYGRPEATDAEVEAAARAAHVDEFARALPDGYDTEVGEEGTQLSGGQRQRITIARAILRSPAVLVLDEATSSLDAQSERYVQDAIDSLLAGRTVFAIAHRLSTVRRADKIVVLDGGRVVEVGNHETLMARRGLYHALVSLQTDLA
jgi:subfamily B ATP-binding cassette protein MsbA